VFRGAVAGDAASVGRPRATRPRARQRHAWHAARHAAEAVRPAVGGVLMTSDDTPDLRFYPLDTLWTPGRFVRRSTRPPRRRPPPRGRGHGARAGRRL